MSITKRECAEHDKHLGTATALDSHKLKEADAIRKLSQGLGEKFLKFYDYGSLQGEVLVIYLTHPGMVNEFKMKAAEIIPRIKEIYDSEHLEKILTFRSIKPAFKAKPAPVKEQKEPYRDRATGNFEIPIQDEQLKKAFERVRKIIKGGHENG